MKPFYLMAIATLGVAGATHAHATSLTYDHSYEDVSQGHEDEIKLSHKFDFGLKLGAELKFTPADKSNGDAGDAFDDDRWHETKISLGYPFKLTSDAKLEPGFSWSRKQDQYKYKPYLKFAYDINNKWDASARYRYEVTDRRGKETKRQNRVDLATSYQINKFNIGYRLTLYRGHNDLFDNKKMDYAHRIKVSYKLTKSWSPFVELKNKSVDSDSDQRQTEYKVGVKYKF